MSRKPQKYRLFAQRLPEKAAENSQKNSHSEKVRVFDPVFDGRRVAKDAKQRLGKNRRKTWNLQT